MHMGEVEAQEVIENGETTAAIGLFAHNTSENGSRRDRITSDHGEDTMKRETKFLVSGHPMGASGPLRLVTVRHDRGIDRRPIEIDEAMELTDVRNESAMEACRLELSSKEVEQQHELSGSITGQLMNKLHKAIMVAAVRAFLMTWLPTDMGTLRLEMVARSGKLGTTRGPVAAKTMMNGRIITGIVGRVSNKAGRSRRQNS